MNKMMNAHRVLGALAAACLTACGGGSADTVDSAALDAGAGADRNVTVAAAASGSTVVVRARATLAAGVGATMVVRAEGAILGSVSVNNVGTSQDYSFATPVKLAAGARVDVVFVNDGVTLVNGVRTEDRNLIVDSISVDGGAPIAANASGVVVDKGEGIAAFDGVDTVPGQSGLWWNGALRFMLPASTGGGHSIAVHASASLAGGTGAQMVVRVDGQVVGNATVNNVGAAQAYRFALAASPAAGAKVDVAFINDGVTVVNGVRTEDRNLYIESIAIDGGSPIKPTDTGVTLDRGAGAAAYDGVDVIPGQRALAWNGALRFTLPGVTPPPTALHTFTLRARSTTLGGVGAAVSLRVGGQVIGSAMVNAVGTPQDIVFTTPVAIPPGTLIDVVYTNDGASATESRDLFVESLTLDGGTPMLSTDAGVLYDKGDGVAAYDGVDILPGQVALPWNGALRFPIDNQPIAQTLTVRARGVSAGGEAPQMELWVDGAVVYDSLASTTVTSVPNAASENFTFNVSTRPGSRIDVRFANPGSMTDVTGTVQRALVIESVSAGTARPIAPTAPGVIFDAGGTDPNVELAPWRDGLNVQPGFITLTEGGALRFSLGMLGVASATAGTPVAGMSTAQKIAATRMAYALLASPQAQRASLLQFPELQKARAPLIPLTPTIPAVSAMCPSGGGYQASFDGSALATGAVLPASGKLLVDWSACATSWASATGTSASEVHDLPYPDPVLGPNRMVHPAVATTEFRNAMHWTQTLPANQITGTRLPPLDLDLTGTVWTSSRATSGSGGRFMNGKEWFRMEDLLIADRVHGTQARVRGNLTITSAASYSATNGASSFARPLGLQFNLGGVNYDVEGIFNMHQSTATKEIWTLLDLTVSRGGVLVGHLSSWGSPLTLEVDGQRLPW